MTSFIGTKPSEVPSNAMLGKLAYVDGDGGIVYSAITAATTINGNDKCRLFDVTSGTFTLSFISAANLPLDWKVYVRNSGTGTITLDPSGVETIDGVSTLSLFSGETRLIYSTGTTLRSVLLVGEEVLYLTEEYTQGTAGVTFTQSAWSDRPLNTVKTNRINGASLASNIVTLPAGTYEISGATYRNNNSAGNITRVWNNTASSALIYGLPLASGTYQDVFSGVFTLTTTSGIKIQHYSIAATTTGGVAANIAGVGETYANITIRKIA